MSKKPRHRHPKAVAQQLEEKVHSSSSSGWWWWLVDERYLPRLNTVLICFLWITIIIIATSKRAQPPNSPETLRHEMQHLKSRLTSQAHHQLTFNIHPNENGQRVRYPPHAKDFITGMDLLALQEYQLCCSWDGNFVCDDQRVRAVVASSQGPFLEITSFIGKVDAHCVFSWTEMSAPQQ